MSIDSPHGGSSDTPDSQDVGASIKKKSLPHGVTQKIWDEAERIIQEASAEVAQTLGEDGEPIGTLESRILKIFEDAQLRMNEILLPAEMTRLSILLQELKDSDLNIIPYVIQGDIYCFREMNYISMKITRIIDHIFHIFKTTGSKNHLLACIESSKTISSITGIEGDILELQGDKIIIRARITSMLKKLIEEYRKTQDPKIQEEYEKIFDFARKYRFTHTVNEYGYPGTVFNRNLTYGVLVPSGTL